VPPLRSASTFRSDEVIAMLVVNVKHDAVRSGSMLLACEW
jgi:hypothetical protein